jgi:alcohol dehydrogenase class IV
MVAVCSSGVGLAHFMSDALSQRAQISHGSCVGLMLPCVMEFNLVSNPPKFAEVARLLGEPIEGLSVMEAADLAADAVRRLLSDLGMPLRLRDVGVGEADVPDLVEDLIQFQSVPITLMNPREVGREDAAAIYSGAL